MPRNFGITRDCNGCRYWSEMLAQSIGGGPVEAVCLAQGGPLESKYVTGRQTCGAWESGHFGPVDDPPDYGESVRALYADEATGVFDETDEERASR